MSAKSPSSLWRDLLGALLVAAFIGAMAALFWKGIPTENEQLLAYMLGQLSGFVAGVVGYHYITKAGEKELEAQRTDNTARAFEAIKAAASSSPGVVADDALKSGDTVEIKKEGD